MNSGNCRKGTKKCEGGSQVRSRKFSEKSVKEGPGRCLFLEAGKWVGNRVYWRRAKFCTFSGRCGLCLPSTGVFKGCNSVSTVLWVKGPRQFDYSEDI